MSKLVSVIIPAYNSANYIEATIVSVLEQSYENFELIVVDDGSTDNQDEIINALVQTDTRLTYHHKKNGGVSSARNYGLTLAKGEYLAFLDADDLWLTDNLELKVKYLETSEDGMVHSDAQEIDSKGQLLNSFLEGKSGWILDDLLSWNGTCVPAPSSILVKKEVVKDIGDFCLDLSNSADQEFFFRVASKYKIGRIPQVTWYYRLHENQMHTNIKLMEHDLLIAFKLAESNQLFKNRSFKKACFGKMYMILGKSWIGDGKKIFRGSKWIIKSILVNPRGIANLNAFKFLKGTK